MNNSNLFKPYKLLATLFGIGLFPIMQGTIGSMVGVIFWMLLYWLLPIWLCFIFIILGFFIGIKICQLTSHDVQIHDHSSIIWDEFISMGLIIILIPRINYLWLMISFVLFRFFDILKPWPTIWIHKNIKGGLGIMLDDITAAIYSYIILIYLIKIYYLF